MRLRPDWASTKAIQRNLVGKTKSKQTNSKKMKSVGILFVFRISIRKYELFMYFIW